MILPRSGHAPERTLNPLKLARWRWEQTLLTTPPLDSWGGAQTHTGALPSLPMAFGEDGKTLPSPGDSNCRLLPPPLEPLDDQQGTGG